MKLHSEPDYNISMAVNTHC